MRVQTFISEFTIQAFHKGVLRGVFWLDKAQCYTGFLAPKNIALLVNSVPLSQVTLLGLLRSSINWSKDLATCLPLMATETN